MRVYAALVLLTVFALGCGGVGAERNGAPGTTKTAAASATFAQPAMARMAPELQEDLPPEPDFNTEGYDRIYENPFLSARENPLSTFSIDVDTASYSNVRRFLEGGTLPPKDAVRIEELVNYFNYAYPPPDDGRPFAARVEVAACPWNAEHRLARIAIKGREIPQAERPAANLVFLLDVSGSMGDQNKLPLLKRAMRMLVEQLDPRDRVAITAYAGSAGLVLPPTSCDEKAIIVEAIGGLQAGGSTAGGAGIQLAYELAERDFDPGRINRVILCTDGDFNVGISDAGSLTRLIEEKARGGVYLTVLGFGTGNYKDSRMEQLADHGNGNYGYIDTLNEARKLLVEQLGGTLVTIAKDVKIQVDFNPAHVGAYRLIGYENRMLKAEDFRDDTKDAGEIGAGHTVTAFYELVPPGQEATVAGKVEPSKYQQPGALSPDAGGEEILTVRLAYKLPDEDKSTEVSFPVTESDNFTAEPSEEFQFASAVACFGMLLRDSEHRGQATFEMALELANAGKGPDAFGYRAEFVQLAGLASALPRE